MTGTRGGQSSTSARATPYRAECGKCGARRIDRQLGLEKTPGDYVAKLVEVFRDVRRVLRDDGSVWINLGDGFAGFHGNARVGDGSAPSDKPGYRENMRASTVSKNGFKNKDLFGIPWAVAFALRDDGWFLRDAVVWSKAEVDDDDNLEGSCMPGSQRDRCTFAYEMIFQLTKRPVYYFDLDGCRTKSGATLRNVWRVNPQPNRAAHFATWPVELVSRMVRLGTSEKGACPNCGAPWRRLVERDRVATRPGTNSKLNGLDLAVINGRPAGSNVTGYRDTGRHCTDVRHVGWEPGCRCDAGDPCPCVVLDCFSGSGTTLHVASLLGRRGIGIDLSVDYHDLARERVLDAERPHRPRPRSVAGVGPIPGQRSLFPDEPESTEARP